MKSEVCNKYIVEYCHRLQVDCIRPHMLWCWGQHWQWSCLQCLCMMVMMSRNILEQMMKLQQDFKMQMKKQEQVAIKFNHVIVMHVNHINHINRINLPAIIIQPYCQAHKLLQWPSSLACSLSLLIIRNVFHSNLNCFEQPGLYYVWNHTFLASGKISICLTISRGGRDCFGWTPL